LPLVSAPIKFDAGACPPTQPVAPSLVCFGTHPETYAGFLEPRDAGWAVGESPTVTDFRQGCSEGIVCVTACGPLSMHEIAAALDGEVRPANDAGSDACCFWVTAILGV
jgi:hypothetical protein